MKPDFSGEYLLNRRASSLSSAAVAVDRAMIRIEHSDPVVHYSAKFESGGKCVHEFSFQMRTDDPEILPEPSGARMYWDGDVLVSEFRTRDPSLRIVWHHELLDGGHRLRASETLRGQGRDQDNVWEFERRGAPHRSPE